MPGAQVAADLPTVGTGRHQVQQHQVPALAVDGGHGLLAVGLAVQAVARVFQVKAQGHRDRVVVFNQKQVFVHGWLVPPTCRCAAQATNSNRAPEAALQTAAGSGRRPTRRRRATKNVAARPPAISA